MYILNILCNDFHFFSPRTVVIVLNMVSSKNKDIIIIIIIIIIINVWVRGV